MQTFSSFNRLMIRHRLKIILGTPIIFVLLLSGNAGTSTNAISLSTETSHFVEVGDELNFAIDMQSNIPVNAVGASLSFPSKVVNVTTIAKDDSVVDLWIEEPVFSNTSGTIHLSGGITREEGVVGRAHVVNVLFKAMHEGKAAILVREGALLARDGKGTNILQSKENIVYYVREKNQPTPDVNGDGALSLADAALVYLSSFKPFDARFDFTGDGKVSFADVMHVGALTRE